jgi:hypothetical protein
MDPWQPSRLSLNPETSPWAAMALPSLKGFQPVSPLTHSSVISMMPG